MTNEGATPYVSLLFRRRAGRNSDAVRPFLRRGGWIILAPAVLSVVALHGALAMEVNVVAHDRYGELVLRTGDLTTPAGLSGTINSKTLEALTGQGVGPIFGSLTFAAVKPPPVLLLPPAPSRPSQVPTSLQLVSEPPPISTGLGYGLTYGGISIAPGVTPPGSSSTTPPNNQLSGHFELDGTVGTLKAVKLTTVSMPIPNPLPGTVGLFLTGLGVAFGVPRLLSRARRLGS
jgi:hypothetical protein